MKKADGTVGKALEALDLVASFERPVRFNEVLEISPYPKATLYRLIQSLTNQGMLSFDSVTQTYTLGMRLVRLAHVAWSQSSLAPIARPYIEELSKIVGDTVHLAQLDNAQVLYVDKRNATVPVQMFSQAGKVGPAYCTGVGKAMIAFLPEVQLANVIAQQSFHPFTKHTIRTETALREELLAIKKRGYGFDREEHEPGIICISVPILSSSGGIIGALSVTTTTATKSLGDLELLAPQLKSTATKIAQDAQSWRFPDQSTIQ